jgi:glycosyltransferase involved in cell wall biosynthesis
MARQMDLHVFFAHRASPLEQARAGFGTPFEWDVDITSGYAHTYLNNIARWPGTDHFLGCDTPEIRKVISTGGFDVLLITGWNLRAYIQGLVAAKRLRIPVMVRGDSQLATPRSRLKNIGKALAYPPFLRMFDAALYVGQRSRAYYEHHHYPAERLFFSPHCVDTEWFAGRASAHARARLREKIGCSPGAKLVLFAGKLIPFKRPLDMIAAAALCRADGQEIEIVVAGDGELRRSLVTAAQESAVPLHLLGFCNQTEMPTVYAAADCLVLPSDGRETWGLVANESLACGRPIIVSEACGCAPDLTSNRAAGRRFPVGDVRALCQAMKDVTATPPESDVLSTLSLRYGLKAAAEGIRTAFDHLKQPCFRRRGV